MTTAAKKPRPKKAETSLVCYKAFDKNLACRDFQYEVGKTYTIDGDPEICSRGFHACEHPFDVFNYYPLGSRVARVTLSGKLDRQDGDSKVCGASITIDAELTVPEFVKAAVAWIVKAAKKNVATGYSGHAAATGDWGHAAATGYSGHAAATGNRGHAAVSGKNAIAASLGYAGTASAAEGGAITLAYYDPTTFDLKLVRSFMVGEAGVEPGTTYRLSKDGKPEEVK